MFGDPLAVSDADLVAAGVLVLAGGAALAALHRPLSASSFDASGAAALGLRPGLVRLALLSLLAAAVAVAVQGLGALLVLAVLVAPPVAVRRHARTPGAAMLGGAARCRARRAGRHPALGAAGQRGGGVGRARAVRERPLWELCA